MLKTGVKKRIHKEMKQIEKLAINKLSRTIGLVLVSLLGWTFASSLLQKETRKENGYHFECYGISATNNSRQVIVTLAELAVLKEVLEKYQWEKQLEQVNGEIIFTNGKDRVHYNSQSGKLYHQTNGYCLTLRDEDNRCLQKIFEE